MVQVEAATAEQIAERQEILRGVAHANSAKCTDFEKKIADLHASLLAENLPFMSDALANFSRDVCTFCTIPGHTAKQCSLKLRMDAAAKGVSGWKKQWGSFKSKYKVDGKRRAIKRIAAQSVEDLEKHFRSPARAKKFGSKTGVVVEVMEMDWFS